MKLENPILLKSIFALKGNFSEGHRPAIKQVDGIEIAPFMNNAAAAVCISGDLEMSWAWRGREGDLARERGLRERANVPRILAVLDEHQIPVTWASVGHLFLSHCERSSSGVAHEGMPRPCVNERWTGDWYAHDPCTDVDQDPLWYAPDLIQQIMYASAGHEIGTHSFSHINFSRKYSDAELIMSELNACKDAMRPFGLTPRSLVFPHNVVDYSRLPVLADAGIIAVRHRDEKIRLSYPERTPEGIFKLYESMNLRIAKHYDYFDKERMFIEEAIKRQAAYCLWFHPSDPMEVFRTQFSPLLKYIAAERKSGRVWIATMRELAAYCEARERLTFSVVRDVNSIAVTFKGHLDSAKYGDPLISLTVPVSRCPSSVSIESNEGQRLPVASRLIEDFKRAKILVNLPATTRSLHLTF